MIRTNHNIIRVIVKNPISVLETMLSQNGGRITSKEADSAGIHRMYLKKLVDEGKIVQVSRGIYQDSASFEDELFNLQAQYPSGIFSYETSLFLQGLLERVPFIWTMTFKGSYHSPSLESKGICIKHSSEKLYPIDITETFTKAGNKVRAYSAERTLCEIMTKKANTDIQVITYAIKAYATKKEKKLPKLMELSKLFHVEARIRAYLEVLL
ncbi:MAG: type IV toxin-antitoxin system AbiEi family antitoxin domain-containing protein [Treponema sp.]|nr:type IV toxin-antitoxin system AbiEi family antitoxin domain-containing protein [Treponema sp.]